MKQLSQAALAGLLLAVLLLCGCGDVADTVQKTADQVQQSVSKSVESTKTQVQEKLEMAGSSELTVESPVKTAACYAIFTPATAGRPSVLALQSYRNAASESFPSMFVQANVSVASLPELVGQTVPAIMFVKPTADGPTWHTPGESTVQLKIAAVEGQQVTAEIVGGMLSKSDGSATQNAVGKFTAVVP